MYNIIYNSQNTKEECITVKKNVTCPLEGESAKM